MKIKSKTTDTDNQPSVKPRFHVQFYRKWNIRSCNKEQLLVKNAISVICKYFGIKDYVEQKR